MQVYFEYAVELQDPESGVLTHLPPGTPLEMPEEEALARIAAGGVRPIDVYAHEQAQIAAEVATAVATAPAPEVEQSNPPQPEPEPADKPATPVEEA